MFRSDTSLTVEKLQVFKEAGADFDKSDGHGYTALLHMCKYNASLSAEKLQFFRDAGADFDKGTKEMATQYLCTFVCTVHC
jgi:hypothetical protein